MGISKEPQANEETPTKNYANQPSHHALSHIILPSRLAVLLDFRSRLFAQFRNERIHPINEPHVMIRDQVLMAESLPNCKTACSKLSIDANREGALCGLNWETDPCISER